MIKMELTPHEGMALGRAARIGLSSASGQEFPYLPRITLELHDFLESNQQIRDAVMKKLAMLFVDVGNDIGKPMPPMELVGKVMSDAPVHQDVGDVTVKVTRHPEHGTQLHVDIDGECILHIHGMENLLMVAGDAAE